MESNTEKVLRCRVRELEDTNFGLSQDLMFQKRSTASHKGRIRTLLKKLERVETENENLMDKMGKMVSEFQLLQHQLVTTQRSLEKAKSELKRIHDLPWYKKIFE